MIQIISKLTQTIRTIIRRINFISSEDEDGDEDDEDNEEEYKEDADAY